MKENLSVFLLFCRNFMIFIPKLFRTTCCKLKGYFFHSLNRFHMALLHSLPSGLRFRFPIIAFSAGKARWIAIQFNLAHRGASTVISSNHDVDIWGSTCKNALLGWVIKFIHLLSSNLMWTFPFQLTAVKKINKSHAQLDQCLHTAEYELKQSPDCSRHADRRCFSLVKHQPRGNEAS